MSAATQAISTTMAESTYRPLEALLLADTSPLTALSALPEAKFNKDKASPLPFLLTSSALHTMGLWTTSPEVPQAWLRFHHLHDRSAELVARTVQREVEELQSTTLLLRESSIGSILLSHLMELEGQRYLRHGLKRAMKRLLQERKALEIESIWLKEEEQRRKNAEKLKEHCQYFLETLVETVSLFPSKLRFVLRQVVEATSKRFPELEKEQVLRNTVSAVFFLRFVCPNLVTFKLKDSHDKEQRRNVVLVSKVLLSLASGQDFQKKDWKPLNSFIQSNQQLMLQLCELLIQQEEDKAESEEDEGEAKEGGKKKEKKKCLIRRCQKAEKAEDKMVITKEKELEHIFNYLDQNQRQVDRAIKKLIRQSNQPKPVQANQEDPLVQSFMASWNEDNMEKFGQLLMSFVDKGDPNFDQVSRLQQQRSSSDCSDCDCSCDEDDDNHLNNANDKREELSAAKEASGEDTEELSFRLKDALQQVRQSLSAKQQTPEREEDSEKEEDENFKIGMVYDPQDFERSIDWFEAERKHHRFTVLVYHKGLWCPLCGGYLRVWNRYAKRIHSLGGAVFGMSSMAQESALEDARANNIHRVPNLGDIDLSLYTYLGGEFAAPKELLRSVAKKIENAKEYPSRKMTRPALFVVDNEGRLLYSWTPVPNWANFFGNRDRPHPKDILRVVKKSIH